jgi:tetratricopeptide (TPR) repeat protein
VRAGETISWRIASDMVSRARTAGAFAGGMMGIQAEIPLREEVVQFLLDRSFSHLLDDDRRLMRLGPAIAEFAGHLPSGTHSQPASGLAGLGISRLFANQIEQAGGATFLAAIAEKFGISEKSVHRLVAMVDGQPVGAEGRIAKLQSAAQWLADVRAQLMRPTNEDADTRRLKATAATALAEGSFETAMDTLRVIRRDLREIRRRTEERLQDEALALRIQMVEEARAPAGVAEMLAARGVHAQAAELFAEAAVALPRADDEAAWRYNLQRADALLQHARERDDAAALSESISVYGSLVRQAAEKTTNTKSLAEACLGHGEALLTAGERDPNANRLKDAIAIFQKAIQLLERERDSSGLIRARFSLAKAMARQGERDGSVETLRQAAQAFRDASASAIAEKLSADTVSLQLSLGSVLLAIEERAGGIALLRAAADAYRGALSQMDSEVDGERWGEAQMNLGLALLGLGEQSGSGQQLEEATQAFRAAIEVTPRVRAPRRWALTQMNLGNALAALGDSDATGTTLLDEAIDAYNLALEELLRDAEPLKWAITQMNLGTALIRLGERVDRRRHWLAAASTLVPALEVFEQQGADELAEMARRNLRRFQESWDSILAPPGSPAANNTAEASKTPSKRPRLAQTG